MAGKNKIEKGIRVYVDDSGGSPRDLTGDLVPGTLTGAGGKKLDEVELTGVSNDFHNFLAGHANSEIKASFYLNDAATTGAHTVTNGIAGATGTLLIEYGSAGAAPTTGDPTWSGEYVCLQADVALNGNKPVINCTFKPTGSVAPAWGTKS